MTYKQIEKEFVLMFNVDPRDKSRKAHILKARHILIHTLRFYSSEISGSKKICDFLDIKQHGTINNSLRAFSDLTFSDKKFKKQADVFTDYISQHQDSFLLRNNVSRTNNTRVLKRSIKIFKERLKELES